MTTQYAFEDLSVIQAAAVTSILQDYVSALSTESAEQKVALEAQWKTTLVDVVGLMNDEEIGGEIAKNTLFCAIDKFNDEYSLRESEGKDVAWLDVQRVNLIIGIWSDERMTQLNAPDYLEALALDQEYMRQTEVEDLTSTEAVEWMQSGARKELIEQLCSRGKWDEVAERVENYVNNAHSATTSTALATMHDPRLHRVKYTLPSKKEGVVSPTDDAHKKEYDLFLKKLDAVYCSVTGQTKAEFEKPSDLESHQKWKWQRLKLAASYNDKKLTTEQMIEEITPKIIEAEVARRMRQWGEGVSEQAVESGVQRALNIEQLRLLAPISEPTPINYVEHYLRTDPAAIKEFYQRMETAVQKAHQRLQPKMPSVECSMTTLHGRPGAVFSSANSSSTESLNSNSASADSLSSSSAESLSPTAASEGGEMDSIAGVEAEQPTRGFLCGSFGSRTLNTL